MKITNTLIIGWLSNLFLLLLAFSAHGQQVAKVTPSTAASIGYYEYLPPGYATSTEKFPVVLFMHGIGERGNGTTELSKVATLGPALHAKNGYQFPFILISPQLKSNFNTWPPWYIDTVLEYVKTYLRIDESRVYFTGLSLGGGGVWQYAHTYPEKMAAMAIVCGSQNTPAKACTDIAANNIPIWAFHGDKDTTVPPNRTINMINAINACVPAINPAPILTIYPGIAHNAWGKAYRTDHVEHNPNVYEWMMQFRNGGVKVDAGPDIVLNLPQNSTNITGTASTESGSITAYQWAKVSGIGGTITNSSSPTVSITGLSSGIYVFSLTVTSSSGETATDNVTVSVVSANQIPVSNAGPDKTITLPTSSTTLNGSGTDVDGTIVSYSWAKVSGPTMTGAGWTSATLSLSNLVEGTYTFSLTVTDNNGATATDEVMVTVNAAVVNQGPSANAGPNITVNLPTNSTTLNGSGSDPDGSIASYLWEKRSGPSVTLSNSTTANLSLTNLVAGIYVFRLTVTDNTGATAFDEATITVVAANQSPMANAGPDITITLPTNSTNIVGSGNDPDGSIASFFWEQLTGPNSSTLTNINSATLSVSNMVEGAYTYRLTVTDNLGATSSDVVQVTVNAAPVNVAPTANAGVDRSITLPINSVVLNGTGNDTDGTIAGYSWAKVSGPAATLSGQNTNALTVDNMVAGSYVFRLTVTDNQGATGTDDVIVTVQPAVVNQSPIANAGPNIVVTLPSNTTIINGSGSDPDGTIATYAWTKQSGPTVTINDANTATLSLSDLVEGTYVFRLTVHDNLGATGSDDVTVLVSASNIPPVVNAGPDITLNLPTMSTVITATASDPDGTISSYLWTQESGPGTAALSNQSTISLTASDLVAGTYTFRLTVTDNSSATSFDEVKVIVNAANLTPTANAGANKAITLPTNSENFTGLGTDPDGTIVTYLWTQVSGPGATLSNAGSPTMSVVVTIAGTYTFRLTVTDNDGASDTDDVVLTVNAAAVNQPPIANAGTNQTITLPQNAINLTGTGTDNDGSIISYLWTIQSGPTAMLTNENSPTVSIANMLEGTYVLRLTVTDDGGLTGFSEVTVSVLPAIVNQVPVANAGANITMTLPTNSTTINGTGSDPDGSIVSYEWTQLSGPAATLTNATNPTLTLSDLVEGVYNFRLTVTDDMGATNFDDVRVTVNNAATNQPPIANAGSDRTIILPTNTVNLTGSGSDPDGSIVRYGWSKVSGPSVTMGATNQNILNLSNLVEGVYTFRLEVEDNAGAIDTDNVVVNVLPAATNQPPNVNAGLDKTLFLPANSILLAGSASDPDGSISSYSWTQVSGPIATLLNANTASATVSNLTEGVSVFRLTATDNSGASSFDEVTITVNAATANQPPVANAGVDITLKLPSNSVSISGSGTDVDGTIASYQWTKVSGPGVTLAGQTTPILNATNMVEGTYTFRLTVTDDLGATGQDMVTVTVLPASTNLPPVVSAGANVTIQLPTNSIGITGTTSDDGTIISVEWTKVSGPTVTMAGSSTLSLGLTNLVEGTYVFRLTATDDGSLTSFSEVSVIVLPEDVPNPPPVVDAGDDIVLELPTNSTTITAIAESPEGLISEYKWIQVSGTPVAFAPDDTDVLELQQLELGNYTFSVTVTDSDGLKDTDDVNVSVKEPDPVAKPSNTFSPNNDGQFDTWTIANANLIQDCEITVYDRQGSQVYYTKGYTTEWDGHFNGKQLPDGVYFYVIRCSGEKPKNGTVTIVR